MGRDEWNAILDWQILTDSAGCQDIVSDSHHERLGASTKYMRCEDLRRRSFMLEKQGAVSRIQIIQADPD